MYSIRKYELTGLRLLNDVGSPMINKGIDDNALQNVLFLVFMLGCRVFMHNVGRVEELCAAVNTELITFGVLFRAAVPAALVALVIYHLVDMFIFFCAIHLGDFIAPADGIPNGKKGKLRASNCLLLLALFGCRL